MQKFTLEFKDAQLETLYQNDKKFIKSLNFYKFLILEFILDIIIILINFGSNVTASQYIPISCTCFFIMLIILVLILAFKCQQWKYTVHSLAFIHLLSMFSMVLAIEMRYKDTDDYFFSLMIYCSAMQLCFVTILMTRIKWFWSSFWDFLYHIYFIFLLFSIEQIQERPMIFISHFICFLSFLLVAYEQEKSMRELYKIISDSNERLNEYRMLIKNIVPFPTIIMDPEQRKIKFVNNSALNLIKSEEYFSDEIKYQNLNNNNNISIFPESSSLLHLSYEKDEKAILYEFEKFLKKCEPIYPNNSAIISNENLFDQLKSISKNSNMVFKLSQESLEFSQLAIRFKGAIQKKSTINLNDLENEYKINQSFNEKYFLLKIVKILWNQQPNILIIINDVTDLNKLKELENLDNYKNQLLATVSHDLRTPLNGMIGMIEAVLPNIKDKKDRKHMNIASRSGYLLSHMINDILDFSQINNKKLRLIRQKIDLIQIIKETLKIIRFQIKAKGLKFIYRSSIEKAEIFSDPCRIKQILLNLLNNSLKFTKAGFIQVSIEYLPTIYQESFSLRIMVEDSGIGIKDEDKPKLFKLFGKLDNHENSKLNSTGIGLGLTISNTLAKMLNPDDPKGIYLESTLGEGSKFWFFLKDEETYFDEKIEKLERSYKNDENIENMRNIISPSKISTEIQTMDIAPLKEEDINRKHLSFAKSIKKQNEIKPLPLKTIENSLQSHELSILQNKKVLIVDDDLINVMVSEMYCKHFGMLSKSVNDGTQAVEFVEKEVISRQESIDFIIMDCNMPIMNGYQATSEIIKLLKNHQKRDIPVIGLTANVLQEDLERCLNVGMTCFLTKPVKREDFGETLKKISRKEFKVNLT